MPTVELVRGALPAEAIESSENKTFRTTKEELFKKLNSSDAQTRNRYRAEYEKIYGRKWNNARNTVRNLFTASQNAKKRQRWEAEKQFRNAEWSDYARRFIEAEQAKPVLPGVPRSGPPARINLGYKPYVPYTIPRYGGKGTRKRNSRKSSTTRKNKKLRR